MANVWTGGTFDLLHPNHIHLFRQCRLIAGTGTVTAAVNADEFIKAYKGRGPVQNLSERLEMVSSIRYIDHTQVNFGGESQRELILAAEAEYIVVGDDWQTKDYLSQINCPPWFLQTHGIKVIYVPRFFTASTTEMKSRI